MTGYSPEAIALADSILKAAGSGLRLYTMHKTREAILTAAQEGINKAAGESIRRCGGDEQK